MLCGTRGDAQVGHATGRNGDIGVLEDYMRGHTYQTGMANDKVGRLSAVHHTDDPGIALP